MLHQKICKPVVGALSGAILSAALLGIPLVVSAPFTSLNSYASTAQHTQKVSAKVGKPLKQARELMEAKKWKDALAKTREAEAVEGKNAAEAALVNEMLAFCFINLNDYASAAAVYETMLAQGQFTPEEEPKRILTLSQMYFALKNYPKSIALGERHLKQAGNDLAVLQQVAQAYYWQNNFAQAGQYTERLLAAAQQQGKPAQEDWLKLLLSCQYKQNQKAAMVVTLERLLQSYPNESYWSDMFVYLLQGASFSDAQNLLYFRLVKQLGLLQANEYLEMAELSLAVANPGEAQAILQEGIARGLLGQGESRERDAKLLALAKSQAAEDVKQLPAIAREAAAKTTGEALVNVGEAYLGHGNYSQAVASLSQGIAKGGLAHADEARLNLGIAYLGQKNQAEAIKTFNSLPASSSLALMARLWAIAAAQPAIGSATEATALPAK